MANESERLSTIHPSIAGFIAVVRGLEDQLSIFEDPTQYVQILEVGHLETKAANPVHTND